MGTGKREGKTKKNKTQERRNVKGRAMELRCI
jgi:hypothetical protein